MYSPRRFVGVSVIVLVVLAGNVVDGKKKKNKTESLTGEGEGKGVCAHVICTKAPEGLTCTRTHIKNPSLLKRLGKLKDCCSAWRCQDVDGSFSTYFGISGDATPDTFTGEAEQYKDDKGGKNDKCLEAKAICPKPDGTDLCLESNTTEATEFKPKGDLDSCCPTYNCTKSDGSYHVHFAMTGGTMPQFTDAEAVAKQKGEASGVKNCSNIICAPKPTSPDDGPLCMSSSTDDSSRITALGPFRECCDVWKCSYDDGSFYVHFELQAPAFWVADTSFYSELPEVPDEGVTIVQDESEEDETTTAMVSTTTPKTEAADSGDGTDDSDESEETTTPAHVAFKPKRHRKKNNNFRMAQSSSQSQIVTVFVTTGGNTSMSQAKWGAEYDGSAAAAAAAAVAAGDDSSSSVQSKSSSVPSQNVIVKPNLQQTAGNFKPQFQTQYQETQYQESRYQSGQQDPPPPAIVQVGGQPDPPPPMQLVGGQPDPNAAQLQSLQAMNMQQMQQMQNMNMQNMQNMQNLNNAQMQIMMNQQNGQGYGGPPGGQPIMSPPMYAE